MKKFVLYSVLFLFPILACCVILEWAVRRIPCSYSVKADYMDRYADRIRILVLGSSHAYTGISPEVLGEDAYSLANFSQTIYYDYRLLRKYADRCSNLKQVIMTVSMFSLYSDLEDGDEKDRMVWYSNYFGINRYPWNITSRYQIAAAPKSLWHKMTAHYLEGEDQVCMSPQGMSTLYTLANKNKENWDDGATPAKRHYSNKLPKETIVEDLTKIAALCYDKRITLYLVTLPSRISYREHCDSIQIQRTRLVIDSLLFRYPNVSYLDYSADSALTTNPDLFYDADHLSSYGAEIFTRQLKYRIEEEES